MRPTILTALLCLVATACTSRGREPAVREGSPPQLQPWETLSRVPEAGGHSGMLNLLGAELAVAPDGRLWLAGAPGTVYIADSIRGDWRLTGTPLERPDSLLGGNHLDRVDFFDSRRALATGYAGDRETGRMDRVYWTEDGGATWHQSTFPGDAWIYHAQVTPAGEAWIGGSDGALFHSADFGKSWSLRSRPFDASLRLHAFVFEPDGFGVAGALGNGLLVSRDAGVSWRHLPTPLDQIRYPTDDEMYPDHRIESIHLYAGTLLVGQDGRLFQSARDPIRWRPVAPGVTLAAMDPATGTVYGVDRQLYAVHLQGTLPRRITTRPLHAYPDHITARGGVLYLTDQTGAVYRVDGRREEVAYALSSSEPIEDPDIIRLDGPRLIGITETQVYALDSAATTWRRIAWLPMPARDFVVRSADELLVWDGHGANRLLSLRSRASRPVEGLRGLDVVDIVRTDSSWLAYGGMQEETARRVEVAQTFMGGQFAGSRPFGFVAVSRDQGLTWRVVDRWADGGVAALFPHPGGDITLFSYLGSVRRLTRTRDGYHGENLLLAGDHNRDSVPYVQQVGALHFADDSVGFVDGWIHHVGYRRFVTRDGGRSWRREPTRPNHFVGSVALGDGRAIASGDGALYLLDGSRESKLFSPRPARADARSLQLSRGDSSTVVASDYLGRTFLVDIATGALRRTLSPAPSGTGH